MLRPFEKSTLFDSKDVETTGSLDDAIAPIRRQPACALRSRVHSIQSKVTLYCRMSSLRLLIRLTRLLDLDLVTQCHVSSDTTPRAIPG
jgi:hypothetical protein